MKDHNAVARRISNEFNVDFEYAGKKGCQELAEAFAYSVHRTLQQSFMRFVIEYVKFMAEHPELTDMRNEKSQQVCKKMASVLTETDCLPFI